MAEQNTSNILIQVRPLAFIAQW
ncbi:hypothetical protein PENFLA_c122G01364 [Penicillium flavigenum]|uniref:Uncharacterized protein n=1 Tax=Penicillium flavigenum TaxID=254877 RepID=A0A1V6S3V3_9EURO|nr:hypothetical protein PENFLA_c122G01364 [Penicillium flavigenum]